MTSLDSPGFPGFGKLALHNLLWSKSLILCGNTISLFHRPKEILREDSDLGCSRSVLGVLGTQKIQVRVKEPNKQIHKSLTMAK